MSTILDALRKLEEERRKSRQGVDPLREALEPVAESPRPLPSRRRQAAWLGAGLLLLVAAVVLTYRLARREEPPARGASPAVTAGARRETPGPQGLAPAPLPPRSETPPGRDSALRSGRGAPGESADREAEQRAARTDSADVPLPEAGLAPAVPAPFSEEMEPEMDEAAPPVESAEIFPQGPDLEEVVPERETVLEEAAGDRGPRASPEAEADRPEPRRATAQEEQGIRISAVVWSPEPESRFAVVNLRTLREGDEVSGRIVDEIHPDGVVFVEGGERYKILLGRR